MRNKAEAALNLSDTIRGEYFFTYHVQRLLFLAISPAGKLIHNLTVTSAEQAIRAVFLMKKAAKELAWNFHKPCGQCCGRWIIHIFLIIFTQSVPAAIFGLAVGLFPFLGLAVSLLAFTVTFSSAGQSAWITAVGLPSIASPADTEDQPAPSAANLDQQQMSMPPFLQSVGGCSRRKGCVRSFRLLAVALP